MVSDHGILTSGQRLVSSVRTCREGELSHSDCNCYLYCKLTHRTQTQTYTKFLIFSNTHTHTELMSQQHASVSQGWICSDNSMCYFCTETEVADRLSVSSSHSILTSGQPIPALTLTHQAPGREATGVPICKSLT